MGQISETKEWCISIFSGLIFLILNKKGTYQFTNRILSKFNIVTAIGGCPTMAGVLIHTLVFILLIKLSMRGGEED
jgi:hypothetical protein